MLFLVLEIVLDRIIGNKIIRTINKMRKTDKIIQILRKGSFYVCDYNLKSLVVIKNMLNICKKNIIRIMYKLYYILVRL